MITLFRRFFSSPEKFLGTIIDLCVFFLFSLILSSIFGLQNPIAAGIFAAIIGNNPFLVSLIPHVLTGFPVLLTIFFMISMLYLAIAPLPGFVPPVLARLFERLGTLASAINPLMKRHRAANFLDQLDRKYSASHDPILRGDRVEAAQRIADPGKFAFLYKIIPADIRRPILWDGRTPSGSPATWLTYSRLTPAIIDRIASGAEKIATKRAFLVTLIVLYFGANSLYTSYLTISNSLPHYAGLPWFAGIGGVLSYLSSYVALFFSVAVLPILTLLIIAPIAAFLLTQRLFTDLAMSSGFALWRDYASSDLRTATRDALVLHSSRVSERENEFLVYNRQVDAATDRLAGDPLIKIGTATGTFRIRGDNEAPVAGQDVMIDFESLRQSMIVVGGSGTGKTRLVLKPLARSILSIATPTRKIGMIVLDGKGVLHKDISSEIVSRDDVITVGTGADEAAIDLVGDMSPADVSSVFEAVSSQIAEESGGFWGSSAALLMQHAASIADTARLVMNEQASEYIDAPVWSLLGIYTIASMPAYAQSGRSIAALIEMINAACVLSDQSLDYQAAVAWVLDSWILLADQTRSGIKAHLDSVIGRFFGTDLGQKFGRGHRTDTVSIEHALRGGILLVGVGTASHGAAGKFAAVWIKTMLFLRARQLLQTEREARKSTLCVMLADEYHMLVTTGGSDSDATMWNIARECGLCLVAATQSVIALQYAIGDDAAKNLLQQCRSKIFLSTDEASTIEYAKSIAGKAYRGLVYHDETHRYYETANSRAIALVEPDRVIPAPAFMPRRFDFGGISLDPVSQIGGFLMRSGKEDYTSVPSSIIAAQNRAQDQSQSAMLATSLVDKLTQEDLQLSQGLAFAVIQRAGVDRSDIVDLTK